MLIRKGNVELDVNSDFLQSYINQGYDVIDSSGNVIQSGKDSAQRDLALKYKKALDEITKLKAEIENLKAAKTDVKKEAVTPKAQPKTKNNK